MSSEDTAVERVRLLIAECEKGVPKISAKPTGAPQLAADLTALLSEIQALRERVEGAERERSHADSAALIGWAECRKAEFLLALIAAGAEAMALDLGHLRDSLAERGQLIENDPFPLWMQAVVAFDHMRRCAQAVEAERDALREGLEQAAMELDEAANVLVVTMPSLGSLFRAASGKARALLSSPSSGDE